MSLARFPLTCCSAAKHDVQRDCFAHLDDIFMSPCTHSTASPTHSTQTQCAKSSPYQKAGASAAPSHTEQILCAWKIWQSGTAEMFPTLGPAISPFRIPLVTIWQLLGCLKGGMREAGLPCQVPPVMFPCFQHTVSSVSLFIISAPCDHKVFFLLPSVFSSPLLPLCLLF